MTDLFKARPPLALPQTKRIIAAPSFGRPELYGNEGVEAEAWLLWPEIQPAGHTTQT